MRPRKKHGLPRLREGVPPAEQAQLILMRRLYADGKPPYPSCTKRAEQRIIDAVRVAFDRNFRIRSDVEMPAGS